MPLYQERFERHGCYITYLICISIPEYEMETIQYASVIVLFGSLILLASGYTSTDSGLTSVPHDIPLAETVVDLSGNAFTSVGAFTYSPYSALQVLRLGRNMISSVDAFAFSGTAITQLYLSANRLTSISDLRQLNQTLTRLYLDSNPNLAASPNDSLHFSGVQLVILELSKTDYNYVEALKFQLSGSTRQLFLNTMGNLTSVGLMGNFTQVFRLELASNLELGAGMNSQTLVGMSSLRELNIREIGLSRFPTDVLLPVNSTLEKLFLDKNPISFINESDFAPFTMLKRLYINYAMLVQFPDIRAMKSSLEQLSLAGNSIEIIPDGALDGFENLNYIDMGNNPIGYLPDFGSANDNIEILNIRGTCLRHLDATNASRFTSLKQIYAGGNAQNFESLTNFTVLTSLDTLSMDGGQVGEVTAEFFEAMPLLTVLSMTATKVDCMVKPPANRPLVVKLDRVLLHCGCCWSWTKDPEVDLGTTQVILTPGDTAQGLAPCHLGPPHLTLEADWSKINLTVIQDQCPVMSTTQWSTAAAPSFHMYTSGENKPSQTSTLLRTSISASTSTRTTTSSSTRTSANPTATTLKTRTLRNTEEVTVTAVITAVTAVYKERGLSWGGWMEWTGCTVRCGGGTQVRVMICQGAARGSCTHLIPVSPGITLGYAAETRRCGEAPCPVPGAWRGWAEWGECRDPCGTSTRVRRRQCRPPAYGGKDCAGKAYEYTICYQEQCAQEAGTSLVSSEGADGKGFGAPRLTEADKRPSAIGVGSISVVVLGACIAIAFLLDLPTIRRQVAKFCLRRKHARGTKPRDNNVHPMTKYDVQSSSSLGEEVTSLNNDKVTSRIDDEVTSRIDDEVTSRIDDEVTSRIDDERTSLNDAEVTSRIDDEVTSRIDDERTSLNDAEVTSRIDYEVISRIDDEVTSLYDDGVTSLIDYEVTHGIHDQVTSRIEDHSTDMTVTPDISLVKLH